MYKYRSGPSPSAPIQIPVSLKILISPTIELEYQMAAADSHQANDFSQPPNLALENAWVSLQHRVHSA
jgi:hypothetical protein